MDLQTHIFFDLLAISLLSNLEETYCRKVKNLNGFALTIVVCGNPIGCATILQKAYGIARIIKNTSSGTTWLLLLSPFA